MATASMGPDFYKLLGVSPSASPDEIRTAYRELVKTTHPDLFSSAAEKARATERLTQINEAYAVLGDAEKRKTFDEERRRAAASRYAPTAPRVRTRASSRPAGSVIRNRTRAARRKFSWRLPAIPRKWLAFTIGLVIIAYFGFSVGSQRQVAIAWTLFEQTIIEPPQSDPGTNVDGKWHPVDSYDSKERCADGLKSKATRDEREGSKVILDERHGTTAITVLVSSGDSPAQGRVGGVPAGEAQKPAGSNNLAERRTPDANETRGSVSQTTKRIRNYECRETRFLRESWLRRKLKQLGLSS